MELADIEQAIADEKAKIDAAHAAVAEAREALERAAADERAVVVKSELKIAGLEGAARAFEGIHAGTPLHNPRKSASVNPRMNVQKTAKPRGQPLKTKHIGAVRIRAVDGSINAFALKHGEKPSTVYGWHAKGLAARKIPERWADRLAKAPYLIPRSAWTNGIATDGE